MLLSGLLSISAGCQMSSAQSTATTPSAPVSAGVQRQLILKFRPATLTCDAAGIAALAASSHAALTLVRPMSGNACVVLHRAADASRLADEEARLAKHPAIAWVEPDSAARPQ